MGALGSSVSNMELFFGCCHPDRDFIYEDELREMEVAGLKLNVAFSRLGSEKVYVQHLLSKRKNSVFETMHRLSGYLVVCGGTAMGAAVQEVLVQCGMDCGQMDRAASEQWVDLLLTSG